MVHPTPTDPKGDLAILDAQLRECFGRVVYSHKTHEKDADMALRRLSHIKVAQIILSAVTTGGLISVVFGNPDVTKLAAAITALVSTALLVLNAYTKENDLGQRAQKHKDAADKLWNLRESYLSLVTDIVAHAISVEEVRQRRDQLQEALSSVYAAAPRTTPQGYQAASRALKVSEDLTFSPSEIDQFLPEKIRASSKRI